MVTEMGSATIGGISPALSANAAKSFLEATDKEKKELQVRVLTRFSIYCSAPTRVNSRQTLLGTKFTEQFLAFSPIFWHFYNF